MGFDALPLDLKNIVSDFAYAVPWSETKKDLETCKKVQDADISPVFVRHEMWSAHFERYIPNPCRVFEPIRNFTGQWRDLIDWHAVNELLFRLDFRRKFVKVGGTRAEWFVKFRHNWLTISTFDGFYRFLLCTRVPCFKPLWKPVGFSCLVSWKSPYYSARWLLEDGGD